MKSYHFRLQSWETRSVNGDSARLVPRPPAGRLCNATVGSHRVWKARCGRIVMGCILVMDDDRETRLGLRKALEQEGHQVIEAKDGREGVELCRGHSVELVISDILMPDQDGLETIRLLHADHPEVRVIAVSGDAPEYLEAAEEFGADRTFTKPFKLAEVVQAASQLLESQNPEVQ